MTKHSLINVALVSGVEEHEGRKIQCSDSVAGEKKKKLPLFRIYIYL